MWWLTESDDEPTVRVIENEIDTGTIIFQYTDWIYQQSDVDLTDNIEIEKVIEKAEADLKTWARKKRKRGVTMSRDIARVRIYKARTDMGVQPRQLMNTWNSIQLTTIEWAWDGWLPKGFVTILSAEQGQGKSMLLTRICHTVTTGSPWLNSQAYRGETGKVLWCEAESGQFMNLDRARKFGIPLDKMLSPLEDPLADVCLDNMEHRMRISAITNDRDVKLVIVDSLSASSKSDENSSTGVLGTMRWLAELAKTSGKMIVVTHHLRKKASWDNEAVTLDRIRGSSAITQLSRVVWAMDSLGNGIKRLYTIKSNLGPAPPAIGFRVSETAIESIQLPDTVAPGLTPREAKRNERLYECINFIKDMLVNSIEGMTRQAIKAACREERFDGRLTDSAIQQGGFEVTTNKWTQVEVVRLPNDFREL